MSRRGSPERGGSSQVFTPVADPGFPRDGGINSSGGRQHTILPKFPKNCMKLKEVGPPGGVSLVRPFDSPLLTVCFKLYNLFLTSVVLLHSRVFPTVVFFPFCLKQKIDPPGAKT